MGHHSRDHVASSVRIHLFVAIDTNSGHRWTLFTGCQKCMTPSDIPYQEFKRIFDWWAFILTTGRHCPLPFNGDKMRLIIGILGIMVIFMVSIAGCFADERVQTDTSASVKVTVADILNAPEKYSASNLSIEGKVTSQCGSGCWFILSDDTGNLYVDLKPNNFVIPPSMGKNVVVNGTILEKNGDVAYIGSSVSVEGKPYS